MLPPWRRALAALRHECRPVLPVCVRLHEGPSDYFGWSSLGDGRFWIRLYTRVRTKHGSRRVTPEELTDTLLHEWAHVLSWTEGSDLDHHDPAWGLAYARCYQAAVSD